MLFEHQIGFTKSKNENDSIMRIAVRAIIMKDDKLLMVTNNKGDIKFPGGGVETGETHAIAIKREVEEETGYRVLNVGAQAGIIIEKRKDLYDLNCIFEMKSYYYMCTISEEKSTQSLDEYEAELGFLPRWVSLGEAIEINSGATKLIDKNPWVERELYVLKQLKIHFKTQLT